jgi:hypothetical protein
MSDPRYIPASQPPLPTFIPKSDAPDPHRAYIEKSREATQVALESAISILKDDNVEALTKLYLIRTILDHSAGKKES